MAKIKGTGLVGVVRLLKERRDHVEALLDSGLRDYLDRQVLVASWYPEADFMALLRVMVHFTPKTGGDSWRWLGAAMLPFGILTAMVMPSRGPRGAVV